MFAKNKPQQGKTVQARKSFITLGRYALCFIFALLFMMGLACISQPSVLADGPSPDYACKSCHINGVEKDPLTLPSGEKNHPQPAGR